MQFRNGFELEFNRLSRDFERVADEFPDRRRKMLAEIGAEIEADVQRRVPQETGRYPRRPSGTIRAAQKSAIGSGGGYVAIRPMTGSAPQHSGSRRDRYGTITGALEVGHGKRGGGYVVGRFFYRSAQPNAEQIAMRHLTALKNDLVRELSGK